MKPGRKRISGRDAFKLRQSTGWTWANVGAFMAYIEGRKIPYQAASVHRAAQKWMKG